MTALSKEAVVRKNELVFSLLFLFRLTISAEKLRELFPSFYFFLKFPKRENIR